MNRDLSLASRRMRRWRRMVLCAALSGALGACAGGNGGVLAPAPVPGAQRNVHPGFDTSRFPGEALLRSWRAASPYRWIGYYLPAPCHRETSWVGKRPVIEQAGWGIALLYVGQQAFEGQAPADAAGPGPVICSSTLLTPEQARIDARDAVARAAADGFARGSVIFLDVERMQTIPAAMTAYYREWQQAVLADGSYLPGTYAHQLNAPALFAVAQSVFQAAGRGGTPSFWIAGGRDFRLDSPPWAVGLPYASIWQGAVDVTRTWGGSTLLVDENVADRPSPSAP